MLLKNYDVISYKEDFLNQNEIELITKHVAVLPEKQGVVKGSNKWEVDPVIRESFVKWITPTAEIGWLWDKVGNMVNNVNNTYFHLDLAMVEPLQYSSYKAPGGYYNVHNDVDISSYPHRKLSFTVQLSDENDYQGGDLLIYNHNVKYPFKASRKKGSIVIFLSMLLHEVVPVTSGTRNSLVGWVSGPPLK